MFVFDHFFTYETDLPAGSGFGQFSPPHLLWILLGLLATAVLVFGYRFSGQNARRRTERILAVVMGLSYILRWIWALIIGHFYLQEMLPLHLCAVTAFIDLAAVFSGKTLLLEFGYACGLPSAIAVFILPGIGHYPLFHFYYILFIISHTLLLVFPLIWLTGGRLKPNFRHLPAVFGILLAASAVAYFVNTRIGSNFMFLNGVPENLRISELVESLGNPGYQLAMVAILFFAWTVLYLPFVLYKKKIRKV